MAATKNIWAGYSIPDPNEILFKFRQSFPFDKRLFSADIRAGIAHADGLFHAGILTRLEADKIKNGLLTIAKRADFDRDYFSDKAENVHSFIESNLIKLIGETGGKLQTGRSRNEQEATALRLWLKEEIQSIGAAVKDVQKALVALAERYKNSPFIGYTHLQKAQPILFSHWCMAYFEMLARDRERLDEAWRRTNIMPLGSAALAGIGFELDREEIAKSLGFEGVSANSLDAVSDRDFAVEFIGAASLIMLHLSRMAEDLIIYSSSEFGYIELSDAVATTSSIRPQKKNPDSLELIRGKAGRIFGHQMALLSTMKGLPLAYNKDMQEDKEALFDTVDTLAASLRVAEIILQNTTLNEKRVAESALKGYLNAAELTDYLVSKGIAFRSAREIAGKIVIYALGRGAELHELNLFELEKFSDAIDDDIFEALSLERSLASKNQIGGTSPERVAEAIEEAKRGLES